MSVFIFEIYFAVIFFCRILYAPDAESVVYAVCFSCLYTVVLYLDRLEGRLLTVSMKTAEFTVARTLIIAFSIDLLASRALSSAFARIVQRSMLSIPVSYTHLTLPTILRV